MIIVKDEASMALMEKFTRGTGDSFSVDTRAQILRASFAQFLRVSVNARASGEIEGPSLVGDGTVLSFDI